MSFLNSFLLSQDLFGHLISFNFDKKGDTHNTKIGGFVSILVKVFFAIFIGLNAKKMVFYEENKIGQVYEAMDVDKEPIAFKDTRF